MSSKRPREFGSGRFAIRFRRVGHDVRKHTRPGTAPFGEEKRMTWGNVTWGNVTSFNPHMGSGFIPPGGDAPDIDVHNSVIGPFPVAAPGGTAAGDADRRPPLAAGGRVGAPRRGCL